MKIIPISSAQTLAVHHQVLWPDKCVLIGNGYILDLLTEKGFLFFWCDARQSACAFYQSFGLTPQGAYFYKSGVPYYKMVKLF